MAPSGVPLSLVIGVVVFLLVLAAMCGAIAIWTILNDLQTRRSRPPQLQAPSCMIATSPVALPPPQPPAPPTVMTRRMAPPGVPWFPPLPRGTVLGTLMPERDEDDEDEHDYTEVEDGVTIVRSIRMAARR